MFNSLETRFKCSINETLMCYLFKKKIPTMDDIPPPTPLYLFILMI